MTTTHTASIAPAFALATARLHRANAAVDMAMAMPGYQSPRCYSAAIAKRKSLAKGFDPEGRR